MKFNTDYFSLLLRDAFKIPEQPAIELAEFILPTYNMSPPDVYFEQSPGNLAWNATVPITDTKVPTAFCSAHNIGGLLTREAFNGLTDDQIFKVVGFGTCTALAAAFPIQIEVRSAVPVSRCVLAYCFFTATGQRFDFESPWLRVPSGVTVDITQAGGGGDAAAYVLSLLALPKK